MSTTLYERFLEELSPRLPVLSASVILIVTALFAQAFFKTDLLTGVPTVGKGSKGARRKQYASGGAWELYDEGYRKVCVRPEIHLI